jgi:CCR4-NOT complex subunit CAF16
MKSAIALKELDFAYESGPPVFEKLSLKVPQGARVLLIGANGVGKSTLLSLIAGNHMLPENSLHVFDRSPFYDMGASKRIALVDGDFPVTVDLTVKELLNHPTPGTEKPMQDELVRLLEIDEKWRMCRVSEGQRRRVQLLLSLRKPCDLLLLDEVTSHLDIVVRADLLAWLKTRNESHGTTIVYTTHILDGLWDKERWPTHLAFMRYRQPIELKPIEQIEALKKSSLLSLAESWIRKR